ncbi:MAG TPA: hypothetical protein VKB84_21895 [Candidatus Binataceae bacterium]|jgi:hypothetical protein|nr:hypothetical protein [Candidatus Binataceae bacterium]
MSNIVEMEHQVEQARENLVRTLDEVNRKASATAQELLLPEVPIRRHPIPSLCGALALGLAAGGCRMPAVLFGILAIGSAVMAPTLEAVEHCENGAG